MNVVVISIAEESAWQSCQLITMGLRKAYLRLEPASKVKDVPISLAASRDCCRELVRELASLSPDLIVFLDTARVYGLLVTELANGLSQFKRQPSLRFHAYGDFTLKAFEWLNWQIKLEKFVVEWVCASERQRALVAAQILGPSDRVWVCPFPVADKSMRFQSEERRRLRKKMRIKDSESVVLYAGRLSLQKNVLAALKAFSHLDPSLLKTTHFILAGEFDDIGAPFTNAQLARGEFFGLWQETFNSLAPAVRERIRLLRGLPHESLAGFLSAADVFFSLSLQHDEDFGMAPAEAALTGLPLVLTSWGGYDGFRQLGLQGEWIPLSFDEKGPSFTIDDAAAALTKTLLNARSQNSRDANARRAAGRLGLEQATKLLREKGYPTSKTTFKGFKPAVLELARRFSPDRGHLVFENAAQGSLYEQIYKNYVE